MKKIFSLALLFAICTSQAQILGCIDPLSKNYNSAATVNDGSCDYASARIKPKYSVKLDAILKETSSLIQSDSLFWTSNDDTDTALYEIDNKGVIQNKIELKNVTNTDWEEIAQDNDYFYIGDFGNNVSGNRKDLHILRVEKQSLSQHNPKIDTLSFSYSNQTDFKKAKANTTNFDCEAFVVSGDSIYMFTKEWKEKRTSVYVIPKLPGNHIAKLKESYNVKGLITAATYLAEKKLLVLAGYSKSLSPFLYLFYDYNESGFFSGNKRKIKIALPFHQMEGISTLDGLHYFLTNENFARKRIINVPQQLHQFDLSAFLANYLKQ
ncbi:T9SS C-terminal target domain-containing protein [Flavobacterium caseinilyticum]|uniref:T9SS C-terminal target domain-containing protein n=1 Tax=Flavobacterium caseinilyticum TaxID=2541732 RepID=UPI001FB610E7|nr:T9SS C-terminal target domain-containing protein [Flavobacterium caseinilyticum]